jgi:hypothetical protein
MWETFMHPARCQLKQDCKDRDSLDDDSQVYVIHGISVSVAPTSRTTRRRSTATHWQHARSAARAHPFVRSNFVTAASDEMFHPSE